MTAGTEAMICQKATLPAATTRSKTVLQKETSYIDYKFDYTKSHPDQKSKTKTSTSVLSAVFFPNINIYLFLLT